MKQLQIDHQENASCYHTLFKSFIAIQNKRCTIEISSDKFTEAIDESSETIYFLPKFGKNLKQDVFWFGTFVIHIHTKLCKQNNEIKLNLLA